MALYKNESRGSLANISGLLRKSLTPPENSIFVAILLSIKTGIVIFLWLEEAPSEKQMCFSGSKRTHVPLQKNIRENWEVLT